MRYVTQYILPTFYFETLFYLAQLPILFHSDSSVAAASLAFCQFWDYFNAYCRNNCSSSKVIEFSGVGEIGTSVNPLPFMKIYSHRYVYNRPPLILRCFIERFIKSIDHSRYFLSIIVNMCQLNGSCESSLHVGISLYAQLPV